MVCGMQLLKIGCHHHGRFRDSGSQTPSPLGSEVLQEGHREKGLVNFILTFTNTNGQKILKFGIWGDNNLSSNRGAQQKESLGTTGLGCAEGLAPNNKVVRWVRGDGTFSLMKLKQTKATASLECS